MKISFFGILLFILGTILGWFLHYDDTDSKNEKDQRVDKRVKNFPSELSQSTQPRTIRSNPAGITTESSDRVKLQNALQILGELRPEILESIPVQLFNSNLEPNIEAWEMFGLDEESAKKAQLEIEAVFEEVKEIEVELSNTLAHDDQSVLLHLPPIDIKKSKYLNDKLFGVFGNYFPSGASEAIGNSFMKYNQSLVGGLEGKDRVLEINLTSESTLDKYNRNFEIKTRVMHEGTDFEKAKNNLKNYTQSRGSRTVEKIPRQWEHLFSGK